MTAFDRFKAQMSVLVPVVRRLREELGQERADALVTEALDEANRAHGRRLAERGVDVASLARGMEAFADGDALDYEVLEQGGGRFDFNVHRCAYAEYLDRIGARDLGPMLACRGDGPTAEGMGVDFARTQTIMQGAPCCDFRYALKK
ncbi:MAG TPA: L-2-amino-thiazoline-4-carboxylic acid hydrolase [Alphaproteobacteria bacterium]|jgi:hypothetical protein|nr:L-2-amino-thiazoline-4-carboxylic acid hydrolase [Alphaproteobacteria bacterium]